MNAGNAMTNDEREHDVCLRCGRKLKNPDARKLGYGAVCFKKMQTGGKRLFADILDKRPTSTNIAT